MTCLLCGVCRGGGVINDLSVIVEYVGGGN